jgi:hypothetical protein
VAGPGFKRRTIRGRPSRGSSLLRRLGWLAAIALAGVWVGVGYVPQLDSDLMWLVRGGLFFIGAGLMWIAYDPSEDSAA